MQVVILSFDSLTANSLGCYGNDWIETPHLDRLAAEGVTFDQHFADTIGSDIGMSWVQGRHAHRTETGLQDISLGKFLRANGIASHLMTSDDQRPWQLQADFEQVKVIPVSEQSEIEPTEVPIAHLIQQGTAAFRNSESSSKPRLFWLHSTKPGPPPKGFDSLYFEDFEERGQQIANFSSEQLAKHPAVYGGSVSLIDHWIGELITCIETTIPQSPTLIIVMAAKGGQWQDVSGLANHSRDRDVRFSDQIIRSPLIIRSIGDVRFQDDKSLRCRRLVQTCDLIPTLIDWFGLRMDQPLPGQSWLKEFTEKVPERKSIYVGDDGQSDALRTSAWLCVRRESMKTSDQMSEDQSDDRYLLFTKPEDVWDVNDIAGQHSEILKELALQFPPQILVRPAKS